MNILQRIGVDVCIYGSFAISLHAGKWIKEHDDVDLAFTSYEDYKKAVEYVITQGYRLEKEFSFPGKHHGHMEWNAVIHSTHGGKFDFSYIRDEIPIEYSSPSSIEKDSIVFRVCTPTDLLFCYQQYGEKSEDHEKIRVLESLIPSAVSPMGDTAVT